MNRFFVQSIIENTAILSKEEMHHLRHVLRVEAGEMIGLYDGEGWGTASFLAVVGEDTIAIDGWKKAVTVVTKRPLYLHQSLLKGDQMESFLKRITEVGASGFYPMTTARSIVKEKIDKKAKKHERLLKIAAESMKQSGSPRLPHVAETTGFLQSLQEAEGLRLIAYEDEHKTTLKSVLQKADHSTEIHLFIGPEGGFTEDEIRLAKAEGAEIVTLGKTILRAETAGLYGLAQILYHFES